MHRVKETKTLDASRVRMAGTPSTMWKIAQERLPLYQLGVTNIPYTLPHHKRLNSGSFAVWEKKKKKKKQNNKLLKIDVIVISPS